MNMFLLVFSIALKTRVCSCPKTAVSTGFGFVAAFPDIVSEFCCLLCEPNTEASPLLVICYTFSIAEIERRLNGSAGHFAKVV